VALQRFPVGGAWDGRGGHPVGADDALPDRVRLQFAVDVVHGLPAFLCTVHGRGDQRGRVDRVLVGRDAEPRDVRVEQARALRGHQVADGVQPGATHHVQVSA
jgi:hypothetical protein